MKQQKMFEKKENKNTRLVIVMGLLQNEFKNFCFCAIQLKTPVTVFKYGSLFVEFAQELKNLEHFATVPCSKKICQYTKVIKLF